MQPEELTGFVTETNISCIGMTDGEAFVEIMGGIEPYSIEWSTGETMAMISDLSAGIYSASITDDNGCYIEVQTEIVEPEVLSAIITAEDILCNGDNSGNVNVEVMGGTPEYMFNWSNGETSQNLISMNAGIYTVDIYDANGCMITLTDTVFEPAALELFAVTTDEVSGNDGAIDLNVSGGIDPYNYMWSEGSTVEDLANLTAGVYNVTVIDNNGCDISGSYTVNNDACDLMLSINSTDLNCNGDMNGTATVQIFGGTEPYITLWNNGQSSATATDLAAGEYFVTVEDNNGCVEIASAVINEPDMLYTQTNSMDISCFGYEDGAIELMVEGGVAPYTVEWDNGATSFDIFDLSAGTYNALITDANGCETLISEQIMEPQALEASLTTVDINCYGDFAGEIMTSVSGGIAPYEFEWSNGEMTSDLYNVPAGIYDVMITDEHGCSIELTDTVLESPEVIITQTITPEDTGNDGAIDIEVSGGVSPYTFEWSNGETTEDITGLAAGIYEGTVTDANGCESFVSYAINSIGCPMTIDTYVENPLCYGETGFAVVTINDGVEPYTINWNDGQTTDTAYALTAGIYSVTVEDDNSCIEIASVEITEPSMLTSGIDAASITCYGENNGQLSAIAMGGTMPYAIEWSTGDTDPVLYDVAAGTYTLSVTDANGCVSESEAEIFEPAELSAAISTEDVFCNGDMSGSVMVEVMGGTPDYNFSWNTGDNADAIEMLPAGIYDVIVTDANGCMISLTDTIFEPEAIVISEVVTDEVSGNDGAIDLTITGGVEPYTYLWSNGETTEDLTGLAAGVYNGTVTDANGCMVTGSISVNDAGCNMVLNVNTTDVTCYGEFDGEAALEITGGDVPFDILWSDGQEGDTAFALTAGEYSVTVADNNGCLEIEYFEILQPEMLMPEVITNDITCYGLTDGMASVFVTGGVEPYDILWSTTEDTDTIADLSVGMYYVTVVDANGCMNVVEFEIIEPAELSASSMVSDVICNGDNSGMIDITVTGGTEPYAFEWNDGSLEGYSVNVYAGDYEVIVTDANGCFITVSETINEPEMLDLSEVVTPENTGNDGAIDITVTGGVSPYAFEWSNGEITEDITGLAAGIYNVVVTDDNGCMIDASIPVNNVGCDLAGTIDGTNVDCYGNMNGMVYIEVTGGTEPYTFDWSNGAMNDTIDMLSGGSYEVTVEDANNCIIIESFDVFEPEMLTVMFDTTFDYGTGDGTATVYVNGGTEPYLYEWNDPLMQTTQTAIDLVHDTYTVIVTDNNGCEITDSVAIELWVAISELGFEMNTLVYPNPTVSDLYLIIETGESQSITLNVVNSAGELVEIRDIDLKAGSNTEYFNTNNLAAGLYFIELRNENGSASLRFVKR
jgi:hypothetical protein